jgi:hypothetical protein
LLHAATALTHRAGLSRTIRQHLDGIRSQFVGLILHVVSCAGLKIGVAREATSEKVALITGYFAQVFTVWGLIRDDPHLLST